VHHFGSQDPLKFKNNIKILVKKMTGTPVKKVETSKLRDVSNEKGVGNQ
jgi:hypothetical protein